MNTSELIESYCAMVNDGSGVIVSAMSQEYSYVLTAGHVLKDTIIDDVIVTDHKGEPLKVLNVFMHNDETHREKYDCCVIQIEYVSLIRQQAFPASSLPSFADLVLVGFPGTERVSDTPIKHYTGRMANVNESLIVCNIDTTPGKDTISGMSGGGVYFVSENQAFLVGVEFRMDGESQEQQYGRIQCQGLNRFEEIIQVNGQVSMVPAYLECFSRMRELIFGFNVVQKQNVAYLKVELLKIADTLIEQGIPAPYELMNKYQNDLLITTIKPSEIKDKALWIAYFEFLIICAIIDNVNKVDNIYIQNLERRRRIMYTSDGSNWVGKLDLILKAARKFLDKDGTVIVVSPDAGADMLPDDFHIDRVIRNIALVPHSGLLPTIDQVEEAVYRSFVLTHLEGLRKKCVINREVQFSKIEAGLAQLQAFRDSFNEFIK